MKSFRWCRDVDTQTLKPPTCLKGFSNKIGFLNVILLLEKVLEHIAHVCKHGHDFVFMNSFLYASSIANVCIILSCIVTAS